MWMGAAIALFFVFGLASAQAQDITGTWQGTVKESGQRILVKVKKADGGGWSAVVYYVGRDEHGRAANSVSVQGGMVRWAVASVDMTYEGRLSGDGKTISGTLKGGSKTMGLDLLRATKETEWSVEQVKPMPKDADPAFEVATVRPTDPNNGRRGFHSGYGRRIWCDNETVSDIVQFVYRVHGKQVVGGPEWVRTQRWDVDGYPDVAGEPDYKQMQAMYRKVLDDRFGLKMHRETRTMPVYALRPAKSGPKLTNSPDQSAMSDTTFTEWNSRRMVLRVTSSTIPEFLGAMGHVLEKPVVDQTGLQGKWDFLLKWRPDDAPADDPQALPGLFTAIQDEVGLKLEGVNAPMEVLVIDAVETPGAN
jgi:uncharacterized protein (TIGR03435 family)